MKESMPMSGIYIGKKGKKSLETVVLQEVSDVRNHGRNNDAKQCTTYPTQR